MADGRYPRPGQVLLGKYVVESLIGVGGMGAVVRARHLDLDEPVAIKCLLPEMHQRADIVARFLREAKSAVKLKGEHVARVLDTGRLDNGTPYIAMEHLDGPDLGAIVKTRGAIRSDLACLLVLQACAAIAEAHSIGIIHRDIKSSNLIAIGDLDDRPQLKVLDFGIATAPEGVSDLTTTESVFGTPAYMAPEQMRSSRTADERSDVWSLGIVLYELLEGLRPFRAETYSALCLAVGMDPPEPMNRAPAPVQTIVKRCLEKRPEERYQTVAELAADLMSHAGDRGQAQALAEECAHLLRRSTPRRRSRDPRPPVTEPAPTVQLRPRADSPTSIEVGSGEQTARPVRKRRTGVAIFIAAVALGAAVVFAWQHYASRDDEAMPAPAAQIAAVPSAPPRIDPETTATLVQRDAKELVRRGDEAYAAGRYDEARGLFDRAFGLTASPDLLVHMADCERALGGDERAVVLFQRYLALDGDGPRSGYAREQLAQVAAKHAAKPPPAPAPVKSPPKVKGTAVRPKPEPTKPEPARPVVTREQVTSSYMAARREYAQFREKFGERLETEWAELTTFLQFSSGDEGLGQALGRIETLRTRMRSTQK